MWKTSTIEETCDILDKLRKPITKSKRIEGPYPYYGATGVLSYVEGYLFDEPLVLIGEDGAKWEAGDKTAFAVNGKTWVNNHAHVVRPNREKLLDQWLIYFIESIDLAPYITGLTVPKLNQAKLKTVSFPLPPLEEQKRIVAILDEVFAGVDQAIANTEQNIKNTYEIFESYLDVIFIQDSCADNLKKLEDVIDVLTDYHANGSYKILKQHVELKDQEDFAWMVRSTDFENNFENSKRYIDEHAYNFLTKSQLLGGEIIMSKIGNAGKVYLMPEIDRPCSLAMNLFLIRLNNDVADNEYVFRYLNSRQGKNQIQPLLNGAATQTITKDSVKSLVVPLPSVASQRKSVQKLRLLETKNSRLVDIHKTKLNSLKELKQSLLQKAFAGELTSDLSEAA